MAKKSKKERQPFGGFDPHPELNPEITVQRLPIDEVTSKHRFTAHITLEDIRKRFGVPEHAVVTVRVPGGGDWSSQDIAMGLPNGNGDFDQLTVVWEESETNRK